MFWKVIYIDNSKCPDLWTDKSGILTWNLFCLLITLEYPKLSFENSLKLLYSC
jgi:hypothetical protein